MRHKEAQQLLYEFVRSELDHEQAQAVEEHLARCNRCFGELQIIRETIRIVPRRTRKPSDDRSEQFWARFPEDVEEKARTDRPRPVVSHPIWDEIWSVITYRRPTILTVVGISVLALVAVIVWTYSPLSQQSDQQLLQVAEGVKSDSLRMEMADYFRKSKILLVGISNISMERGEHLDFSTERQAARRLFQQARYLDDRAPDERSHQLIQALERILLELANMEQRVDLPDVEIVRSGIHQENMLFKIRMAESEFSLPDNNKIR
jgi:hypothetical protein